MRERNQTAKMSDIRQGYREAPWKRVSFARDVTGYI